MVYKANKLGESMLARQSEMLIPEEELGSQSQVSYEEDFEELSSNADLYVFNHQMIIIISIEVEVEHNRNYTCM